MLGLGDDRLGAKRKERSLEELYNATKIIDEIEITAVLRGSCRMQGPVEETDLDVQKNMVTPRAERKFDKHSMSRRSHMRAESGTCNVCSAPCSSCMHRNITIMGSKGEEFCDETYRETMASQFSVNEDDVSKVRPFGSLQHATSETSNLLSANSSHDSFSVNAESKATVRSCDISDTSEDFETHPKLCSGGASVEDQLSPKTDCVLDQRIFSTKYDDPKGVEGHDDNIPSVSRANDANAAVSHHDRNVDIKNVSHSSTSVCSLGPEGSGKAAFSQKLDLSDIPSLKKLDVGGGSPKLQSPSYHLPGDKSLSGGSSEVLTKMYPKSEAKIEKDNGDPPDEVVKSSGHDEQDSKLNELSELPDIQPAQTASGDESEESDVVEHDVKVCDICGDAGREDLLAICSRCSDGAEHTYCMREMLQKLPEGDWLCEECKFAEETENQKQGVDAEAKRENKPSTSAQSSKRQAENQEAAPAAKRLAVETSLGSPNSSSPSRTAALSRDSSFKSLDKGKVKPASFGNLSNNDISEAARSPAPLLQAPKGTLLKSNSFSTLISKPKVKPVAEVVPQKQKGSREQVPLDIKEGSRGMNKSMSFKSTTFGRSSTSESKFRTVSPRVSYVQDLKGVKQVKERNSFERKNLSKLDRALSGSAMASSAVSTPKVDQKLTSRGDVMSPSSASNNREFKVVKSEGKMSTLSKSNSNLGRKGVEVPVMPVGASSTNGICSSSVEQKPNQVSPKDEPSPSSSWTAERPSNNLNEVLQDGMPCTLESATLGEKLNVTRPRPILATGLKAVSCQKCKEMGHDAESCSISSPQVSGVDVPAVKNSGEESIKGKKLKAAIEAAMQKLPVSYGRNKVNDQLDGSSMTSVDVECERASQEQLTVGNKMKNMISCEGTHEADASLRNCSDSSKQTTINNVKQFGTSVDVDCERASQEQLTVANKMKNMISVGGTHEAVVNLRNGSHSSKQTTISTVKQFGTNPTDPGIPSTVGDPSSTAPLVKGAMKELPSHASAAASVLLKMSAIPEHEYVWQGGFEVHRGGTILDLNGGVQAHLSSWASPKVLEMVNKFPSKIQFSEVPRMSTWPMKFHESGAKEDHIALYFFAKDYESYEKNYKGLVDLMIKNDLALKGNIDGVELLIFPSSQLPENCQRWNMLFYLWGVFRVRKANCLDSLKNSCITGLNMVPMDTDISTDVMSFSQSPSLLKHINKDSSACDSSQNKALAFSAPDKAGVRVNGDCDKLSCDEQTPLAVQAHSQPQDGLDSRSSSRFITTAVQLSQEIGCINPPLEECKMPFCGQDTELKPSLQAIRASIGSEKDEKAEMPEMLGRTSFVVEDTSSVKVLPVGDERSVESERMPDVKKSGREQVDLEKCLIEDDYLDTETSLGTNLNFKGLNCQQSNHHKRPLLDLTETVSQDSSSASHKMPWNEAFVDGESTSKKLRTSFSGTYGCSSYRDRDSFSDGFSSQIDDLGPSSSVEDKRCDELCDEKVIPEDLGTTERYFFPVDSQRVKDYRFGSNSMPWKALPSKDEDQFRDGFPNLELALGAETKPPNKGMLPFFVRSVDKNNNLDKPPDKVTDKGKEEDVSASLSLSLSFPFPDKEQPTVKPVPKTEQLLPERRPVNTPLFLFRSFLDK